MAVDQTTCANCRGLGFRIESKDKYEVAVPCDCRQGVKYIALLKLARIPARYVHCSVENFEIWDSGNPTLEQARKTTLEFIDCYPAVDKGLLYMGGVGAGKTHLAVAALRELVENKGVQGLFINYLDLVKQMQISYEGSGIRSAEVLRPVVEAELLVLDELGAGRLTDWERDLLYYVINSRYMAKRISIFTTNYKDASEPANRRIGTKEHVDPGLSSQVERLKETLTDRISAPLRSRLAEMCDVISLYGGEYGGDYRSRSRQRGRRQ